MEDISIKKAREEFSDVLNYVAYGNKTYQITRYGKPVAVIVSMMQWKEIVKTMSIVKVID